MGQVFWASWSRGKPGYPKIGEIRIRMRFYRQIDLKIFLYINRPLLVIKLIIPINHNWIKTRFQVEKNQPGLGITFTSSSTSSIPAHFESVESVEALLAARGISVTRKWGRSSKLEKKNNFSGNRWIMTVNRGGSRMWSLGVIKTWQ